MTINYKESSVTGTQWQRCKTVTIDNIIENPVPKIYFREEEVVALNTVPARYMHVREFTRLEKDFNPTEQIALLNPETNDPLGTSMTHQEIYIALYSMYIAAAQAKDAE